MKEIGSKKKRGVFACLIRGLLLVAFIGVIRCRGVGNVTIVQACDSLLDLVKVEFMFDDNCFRVIRFLCVYLSAT